MNEDRNPMTEAPDDQDRDEPTFEELCKQNYPKRWRVATLLMWVAFFGFVGISVYNNYRHASHADSVLTNHTEVSAKVIETIQILQDGRYEDYSVEVEYIADGEPLTVTLEIDEKLYEENYYNATEIPLIYWNDDVRDVNLKSYYEYRADMYSNWMAVLFGYLVVLILLFFLRRYLLKLICSRTGY